MHLIDGLSSALGLGAGGIADVEKAIKEAIESQEILNDKRNVILVLDGLDFLLAATGFEVPCVLEMIGELRAVRLLSDYSFHVYAQRRCEEPTRLFHDHCHNCRPASLSIAPYASRDIPHSFRDELSTPSKINHERTGTRYRGGEGCQWCSQG